MTHRGAAGETRPGSLQVSASAPSPTPRQGLSRHTHTQAPSGFSFLHIHLPLVQPLPLPDSQAEQTLSLGCPGAHTFLCPTPHITPLWNIEANVRLSLLHPYPKLLSGTLFPPLCRAAPFSPIPCNPTAHLDGPASLPPGSRPDCPPSYPAVGFGAQSQAPGPCLPCGSDSRERLPPPCRLWLCPPVKCSRFWGLRPAAHVVQRHSQVPVPWNPPIRVPGSP